MVQLVPLELLTHAQKVCRLYRAGLKALGDHYPERKEYRIQAVLLRARFDAHKNERNFIKAKQLLIQGQKEYEREKHYCPRLWPTQEGGPAHDNFIDPPDWCLDFWDPMEKAQYPDYFARREQRKKEYVENWEKKYGKPNLEDYFPKHH